jgi:uncharacterized protein YhhL (DUF1145 family)
MKYFLDVVLGVSLPFLGLCILNIGTPHPNFQRYVFTIIGMLVVLIAIGMRSLAKRVAQVEKRLDQQQANNES